MHCTGDILLCPLGRYGISHVYLCFGCTGSLSAKTADWLGCLQVVRMGPKLVDATIELHRHVMNYFLPSAGTRIKDGEVTFELDFDLTWIVGNVGEYTRRAPPSSNPFTPSSAVKFHYQFNLRELANITQGLCRMTKDVFKQPLQVCSSRLPATLCWVQMWGPAPYPVYFTRTSQKTPWTTPGPYCLLWRRWCACGCMRVSACWAIAW